jgi:hypothetical protein
MNRRESPSVFGSRPSLSLPTFVQVPNFEFLVCLATFFHTVDHHSHPRHATLLASSMVELPCTCLAAASVRCASSAPHRG